MRPNRRQLLLLPFFVLTVPLRLSLHRRLSVGRPEHVLQVRRQLHATVLVRQWELVACLHLKDVITSQCRRLVLVALGLVVVVVALVTLLLVAVVAFRRNDVAEQEDVLNIGRYAKLYRV